MNYELKLPENYVKPPLPGRDEWCAELRKTELKQTRGVLCNGEGECCLGVLSRVQGRLRNSAYDGDEFEILDTDNPLYPTFGSSGEFPDGLYVVVNGSAGTKGNLADCNDAGLTFPQIADIIEAVWENAPKNW